MEDRGRVRTCLLGLLLMVAGCTTDTEYIRETSPNGLIDAVVVAREGPPPIITVSSVYLVPAGESVTRADAVMRFKHALNVDVVWRGSHRLEFWYQEAFVFDYQNRYSIRVDGRNFDAAELRVVAGREYYPVALSLRQSDDFVQLRRGE